LFGCKKDDAGTINKPDGQDTTFTVTVLEPLAVTKSKTEKIYVHLMPWFETNKSSEDANWGQHWRMGTQNPDIIETNGQRQIASYYYPLIGPYASSDKNVIEYQLLLMKLSGIDGVLIDWPTTIDLYDYPKNLKNAEAFINFTAKVGLEFAIVYEDQNIKIAAENNIITDKVAAAQEDMSYIQTNYFSKSNYIKIDSKPLLLVFGPQTFTSNKQWDTIFTNLSPKPSFLTLWYESGEAGANASGEYSWVYQDANSYSNHLSNFYNRSYSGIKMGSAFPGFVSFYEEGGWGSSSFEIPHDSLSTFKTTLNMALASSVNYIQLVTWNDYGEGTMIEPTVEFGYGFLTTLQEKLGVGYTQKDLEMVAKLYELRNKYTNSNTQLKLNQVFYYLVALKTAEADSLINSIKY
jgi:hypothetical protein